MDFKETCIWMSYRYAIGRKSIAAVTHAKDIAKHIDWIPIESRDFASEDITNEINNHIRFASNIKYVNFYNENCSRRITAYEILFKYLYENPEYLDNKMFESQKWIIDFKNKTVTHTQLDKPENSSFILDDYFSYKDWIGLAKILRKETVKITAVNEGHTKIFDAYEYFDYIYENGIRKLVKRYSASADGLMSGYYIAPEFIKSINDNE